MWLFELKNEFKYFLVKNIGIIQLFGVTLKPIMIYDIYYPQTESIVSCF